MPGRVAVQQCSLVGVSTASDELRSPALQLHHAFIAVRQGPDRDEQATQVLNRLTAGQFIERLV